MTADDRKKYPWVRWRALPWWLRFLFGLVRILAKNLWRLIKTLICLPRRQVEASNSNSSLVTTIHDEEMSLRSSQSGDVELVPSPIHHHRRPSRTPLWTIAGSLGGVLTVMALVRSVGPVVVETKSQSFSSSLLSTLVSWLCAVGLLISSLMYGFGSVSLPYSCLVGLYLKPVRAEVVAKLESELQSVYDALTNKRAILRDITVNVNSIHGRSNGNFSPPKASGNTTHTGNARTFSDIGDEIGNRRQILQSEIEFLEALCQDMNEDIEELKYSQSLAAAARTTMGRIRSYVGVFFSVILLVRLASATINIWKSYTMDTSRHKVAQGDIITTVLLWLTGRDLVSAKDFVMISQLVSLGLTAILSFSQVRTFLHTAAAVHRRLSRFYEKCYCTKSRNVRSESTEGHSSWSSKGYSQIIAGVTGCYCLSCVVLIKMMLPVEFCQGFSVALGGMDVFTIHTSVVNTVFASSAGISLAVLGMLFGIQRQNNLRHTAPTNEKILRGADAC